MEIINSIIFIVFAGLIVLSALMAVFCKKIVHSVLGAAICFMAISGLFFTLNADFVGVTQILIYGVGVSILLAFAIMFTSKEKENELYLSNPVRISLGAIAVTALFFCIMCFFSPNLGKSIPRVFLEKPPTVEQIQVLKTEGTSKIIGKRLFCDYVLPFELLSLLLLAGIVGAGYLAGKEK